MNRELAGRIADTVLYEGYMLYPYRKSALKNQQRWSFGILYPPSYEEVQRGTERAIMHTECLLRSTPEAQVEIELRFLHLFLREAGSESAVPEEPNSAEECVERSVEFALRLADGGERRESFTFGDRVCGLSGSISVRSQRVSDELMKLTIEVINDTPLNGDTSNREAALVRSLLSAHTILTAKGTEFISLIDTPEQFREFAGNCKNIGNFPVLVGNAGERDMMLCSPILLYDYPQIAPESSGDFYDATEIDEMLTLRIMTLTEAEKEEMRVAGIRVNELLQRTEQSAREQLVRTHGTIRNWRPSTP
jgi:hypothetical protein